MFHAKTGLNITSDARALQKVRREVRSTLCSKADPWASCIHACIFAKLVPTLKPDRNVSPWHAGCSYLVQHKLEITHESGCRWSELSAPCHQGMPSHMQRHAESRRVIQSRAKMHRAVYRHILANTRRCICRCPCPSMPM